LKIKEAITLGKERLRELNRPLLECELLLSHALKKDRIFLHLNEELEFDESEFLSLLDRRVKREPLEYIVQSASFYSKEFFVKKGALIPRPESELLVDKTLEIIKSNSIKKICEIGIGSGALSCILALESDIEVVGVDISSEALEIASENVKRFGLEEKIKLKQGDMLSSIDEDFSLIVSNPPYVSRAYRVEKELDFEPSGALYGGEVGDEFIKKMLLEIRHRCRFLVCEIGYDQKDSLREYIDSNSLGKVEFFKDYAGFDRFFVLEFS
jgi:release factor glutamine methyltransferase